MGWTPKKKSGDHGGVDPKTESPTYIAPSVAISYPDKYHVRFLVTTQRGVRAHTVFLLSKPILGTKTRFARVSVVLSIQDSPDEPQYEVIIFTSGLSLDILG